MLLILVALAPLLPACRPTPPRGHGPAPAARLVVLGVDGMDHALLARLMADGRTPNLAALAARGSFLPLGTTTPPQSPVAWATVVTGADSGTHGIFDFIHREPAKLSMYLSTTRSRPAWAPLKIGRLALPLVPEYAEQLRGGTAFWEVLERAGVAASIVKLPAVYPPKADWRTRTIAGMGTPDLLGTQGTSYLLTDDPGVEREGFRGGQVHHLDFAKGKTAQVTLLGPPDPFAADGEPRRLVVEVTPDRVKGGAHVRLGKEHVLLRGGEWSGWIPVAFTGAVVGRSRGMVRLYLRCVSPRVLLYMSPVNVDPLDPALPISSPRGNAAEAARAIGRFHTLGMPEDTKALYAGLITPAEFLRMGELILDESERLLGYELDRQKDGVLFFYFSTLDHASHMFWRSLDPEAGPGPRRYSHVLPALYQRIDAIVGEVVRRVGPDTTVLVMSDHGFAHYRRKVDLNTFLAQRGYLAVGADGRLDWARTQAYGLGLNALYVNLKGREREGVVAPAEREGLLARLRQELEALRDPETGARVIRHVYPVAAGNYPQRAPDLVIGYERGYRGSDVTGSGGVSGQLVAPNAAAWSGDHCVDPELVPGVLVSSRRVTVSNPSLVDLAPTILGHYRLRPEPAMTGRDLLR